MLVARDHHAELRRRMDATRPCRPAWARKRRKRGVAPASSMSSTMSSSCSGAASARTAARSAAFHTFCGAPHPACAAEPAKWTETPQSHAMVIRPMALLWIEFITAVSCSRHTFGALLYIRGKQKSTEPLKCEGAGRCRKEMAREKIETAARTDSICQCTALQATACTSGTLNLCGSIQLRQVIYLNEP